jgi:hypothetical protein
MNYTIYGCEKGNHINIAKRDGHVCGICGGKLFPLDELDELCIHDSKDEGLEKAIKQLTEAIRALSISKKKD